MIKSLTFYSLIFILASGVTTKAQPGDTWRVLSMAKVETKFDPDTGMELVMAEFGPIVSALNGKEVTVKGYIIPDAKASAQSHFMFSSLPVNMCFFCGKAGPESAMEVFTRGDKKIKYSKDVIALKGTLRLSDGRMDGLIYSLENAELVR